MTTTQVLKDIRIRLGDADGILDPAELDFADAILFEYLESAILHLDSFEITSTNYTLSSGIISPDPSNIDGLLMSTWVVSQLLSGDLTRKIKDGELGIRFKSGQDEISTGEAARRFETVAIRAEEKYRQVVGIKLAGSTNAAERLQ